MQFACLPCACMGFLWVLQLPPTIQRHAKVRSIGYAVGYAVEIALRSWLNSEKARLEINH